MDLDYMLASDATSDTSPVTFLTATPFDEESINDEDSNNHLFIESQRELRTLLHDTARSTGPTRVGSPAGGIDEEAYSARVPPDSSTSAGGGSSNAIASRAIVSTAERVNWLRNYIDEVSPWLDMFDTQRAFGRKVPILAATSAPLMYAMLAISARQLELQKKLGGEHKSLQLYQESIKCLTPQLQARDPNILAACVILCCLEMMSASPKNWRKHLDGCAALFKAYGIHGFSSGIPQAVFWCYARMDVCAAIISEGDRDLVLAVESWIPPDITPSGAGDNFRSAGSADMYANYAVWLCARVCHLSWMRSRLHGARDGGIGAEPFIHSWYELWTEVQGWAQNRPTEMIELEYEDGENQGQASSRPFPFLLFAVPCAISSNQLYHTACLLLLEMRPSSLNTRGMGLIGSALWHAHRI